MLAEWVKRKREEKGWTQEELAAEAGLDRVEVNALERGRNKGSSVRIREGLAKAFKIPLTMVGKEPGEHVEYDPAAQFGMTAIGAHRDWAAARDEAIELYGRMLDTNILAKVERASLGEPLDFITADMVKRLHDTIVAAEAEKERRRRAKANG